MTARFSKVLKALAGVLELPDAERPYLELAKAYGEEGMNEHEEAVMFLVKERFGGGCDHRSGPDEEQRKDDRKNASVARAP